MDTILVCFLAKSITLVYVLQLFQHFTNLLGKLKIHCCNADSNL